ncbi:MAG TPA: PEP/pyruvate-binding domain-containing protein, partial [Vicinamibacteria bacterium]
MNETSAERLVRALTERAKELNCLYRVEEILSGREAPVEEVLRQVVEALPPGWQHPAGCRAKVVFRGLSVASPDLVETPWVQTAPITLQGEVVGSVSVYYTEAMPTADEGPFLKEERRLIDTIADRLGQFTLHRELTAIFGQMRARGLDQSPGFRVVLDLLRRTDQALFRRIARKMLNQLSFNGVPSAQALLRRLATREAPPPDENQPFHLRDAEDADALATEVFKIAGEHLNEAEILSLLQVWIREDRVNFLVVALESSSTTLVEVVGAIERFEHTGVLSHDLSLATQAGLKAALIRRLLTDNPAALTVARRFVEIDDFFDLTGHTIVLPKSQGKLGGKSSGLFLATRILRRAPEAAPLLSDVRVPKTWYLPSDAVVKFIDYNGLDDVYSFKYRDLDQIRQEYPHILQIFKSARFPPEIVQGLSVALDDFGERPLIVRSSSLLEDRAGSAFSGKYKSLFLANQGAKPARLMALLDAVAEVYASVFSPDPIQYRTERGLLDQHEEMACMIQEVVGARAGRYFLPSFSGVGLSNNELRWSPRIRREDGLLRLVPGLGTRAVDRLTDDYPVLLAPGQPGLRVNTSVDEVARYSPRMLDVINLERNVLETVNARALLREIGPGYPGLGALVSVLDHDLFRRPSPLAIDFEREEVLFTFEGLVSDTAFVTRMRRMLDVLAVAMGTPVDVEFAHDGRDLYLLQCRPQSDAPESAPSPIPRDIPASQVVFSANRYVSNGKVPDITHIVYVDPEAYARIEALEGLRAVGRAVGALNKILPKRQFVLMGPGRWGSRGDVRLGVSVTYADVSNTAVLVEIARKQGSYVPDLSFGTHFFQDLVESSIRYLPLYPDEPGVAFNVAFLRGARSVLPELLPNFHDLADTLRVIDVPRATEGQVLRVLMNADLGEAVGFLAPPAADVGPTVRRAQPRG